MEWSDERALEDELFLSLTHDGVRKLIRRAIELHGEQLIDAHIKSHTNNENDLRSILSEAQSGSFTAENRRVLGKAAQKKAGWLKTVTWMEGVGREIVGPDLASADEEFRALIDGIFVWARNTVAQDRPSIN